MLAAASVVFVYLPSALHYILNFTNATTQKQTRPHGQQSRVSTITNDAGAFQRLHSLNGQRGSASFPPIRQHLSHAGIPSSGLCIGIMSNSGMTGHHLHHHESPWKSIQQLLVSLDQQRAHEPFLDRDMWAVVAPVAASCADDVGLPFNSRAKRDIAAFIDQMAERHPHHSRASISSLVTAVTETASSRKKLRTVVRREVARFADSIQRLSIDATVVPSHAEPSPCSLLLDIPSLLNSTSSSPPSSLPAWRAWLQDAQQTLDFLLVSRHCLASRPKYVLLLLPGISPVPLWDLGIEQLVARRLRHKAPWALTLLAPSSLSPSLSLSSLGPPGASARANASASASASESARGSSQQVAPLQRLPEFPAAALFNATELAGTADYVREHFTEGGAPLGRLISKAMEREGRRGFQCTSALFALLGQENRADNLAHVKSPYDGLREDTGKASAVLARMNVSAVAGSEGEVAALLQANLALMGGEGGMEGAGEGVGGSEGDGQEKQGDGDGDFDAL